MKVCRDMKFSVATRLDAGAAELVATKRLWPATWSAPCARQRTTACTTVCNVCTLCARQTFNSALCCTQFLPLFMDTV